MTKKYDVVYGESYKDRNGEEKVRWKNVGAVIQTQKGHALLLDRTFNPAGCADPDGRGTVLLNLFEPKPRDERQSAPPSRQGFDDSDVPF